MAAVTAAMRRELPLTHRELLPDADPRRVRERVLDRYERVDGVPIAQLDSREIVVSLAASIVSTRDADWSRQLAIEATLGWPDEAVDVAAQMLGSRGWRRRIGATALLIDLCTYRPESNLDYARTLAEAIDRETDVDVLSYLALALSAAADYEGFAAREPRSYDPADESYPGIWFPIDPESRGLERSHEIWKLLTEDRVEKILSVLKAEDHTSRQRLALALVEFDLSHPRLRAALLDLMTDTSDYVRDWATFVVMQAGAKFDGEDVRAALEARLTDSDSEIRDEAIAALALRRADGALDRLAQAIRTEPSDYLLNAAAELEDPALLPALLSLPADAKAAWAIGACGGPAAESTDG